MKWVTEDNNSTPDFARRLISALRFVNSTQTYFRILANSISPSKP